MYFFIVVLIVMAIGLPIWLWSQLEIKNRYIKSYNDASKELINSLTNEVESYRSKLNLAEKKADNTVQTYNQLLKCYQEEKEEYEKRENDVILKDAELSALKQKMATAYCVHQVIFTKYGKKVLCLAEVIYADSMGQAFAKFVIKRNKRLRDNKIIGAKCGHIQVHRVWKDVKSEPHQNP